jgi:hypothetical protein
MPNQIQNQSFPKSWFFCQRSVTRIATVSDNVNIDWLITNFKTSWARYVGFVPTYTEKRGSSLKYELVLTSRNVWSSAHAWYLIWNAQRRKWIGQSSILLTGGPACNRCNGHTYESCFYTYSIHASDLYAGQHTRRSTGVRRPKGEIYPWCKYVRMLVYIKPSLTEGYTRA